MFCENPRCRFHVEAGPGNECRYIDHDDMLREKSIKRLHIVQQQSGVAPPRDFYFCENCANVLAMTFGKTKTSTSNQNVREKQTPEQETPQGGTRGG